MVKKEVASYGFLIVFAILTYLAYLIVKPFASYIIFSIILVVVFHPLYVWLHGRMERPKLSSALLVVALIILLVIPSIFLVSALITQAPGAYASLVNNVKVEPVEQLYSDVTGNAIDVGEFLQESSQVFQGYIFDNAAGVLTSVTGVIIGLFIMFFLMYYMFSEGDESFRKILKKVPLPKKQKSQLLREIQHVIHGIIQGQLVLGAIQGAIGGVIMWLLGVPNPLFWGFIMILTSIIPFLGSGIVWVPAGLWLMLTGHVTQGIILLILGTVLIAQIDNILRPYIVSKRADVHPVIVLLGVLGGLVTFGFVGFIIGPIILALFMSMFRLWQAQ